MAPLQSDAATPPPEELTDSAIALYLAHRPQLAAELMKRVTDADPETRLYQGLISWELGQAEDAVNALRRAEDVKEEPLQLRRLEALGAAAEALGPDYREAAANAYFDLANIHYREARYPDALNALERTLALVPEHVAGLAGTAEVLRFMHQADKALPFVEHALRLRPDFAWAEAVRGEALRTLGRTEDAAGAFRKAVELDGKVAQWHARLGEALTLLGKPTDALPSLNAALDLDSNHRLARMRRGESYRQLQRFDEALEDFEYIVSRNPQDAWALANKGETLRRMSRLGDAEAPLRRASELTPQGYPFAETALAYVSLESNRSREALGMFNHVLEADANDTWALEGKARVLYSLDQVGDAFDIAKKLAELRPQAGWGYGLMGVLHFQIEQYAEATAALERSTTLDPSLDWAVDSLAACYIWRWRSESPADASLLDKAIEAGRQAAALQPDDPLWLANMAEALWLAGDQRRTEAETNFRAVLAAARKKQRLDYYAAVNAGWAALRLASRADDQTASLLEDAERLTVEALTQKVEAPASLLAIDARFNLALVILCTGRAALALREYENTVALATRQEPGVYRGLVGRASTLLAETIRYWPSLQSSPHAEKALRKMRAWHDAPPSSEPVIQVAAAVANDVQAQNAQSSPDLPDISANVSNSERSRAGTA